MSIKRVLRIRIGIVACEILKKEIELLTAGDPEVVHREYLEMGLHDRPEMLRETLLTKLNDLKGKVDVVFVGYAICKSLDNMPEVAGVPVVMLREEDCIGALLGPIEYQKERSICPGTWFSSPGWASLGIDGVVSDEQMRGLEEMGFDKMYFAQKELEGYSRCLFLDTGVEDIGTHEAQAREFAGMLDLRFERGKADIGPLRRAWQKVKAFPSER